MQQLEITVRIPMIFGTMRRYEDVMRAMDNATHLAAQRAANLPPFPENLKKVEYNLDKHEGTYSIQVVES